MQAFARDDAAAAYQFAAPGIREMFPDPDAFLAMVRRGYAPVYRHRSADFGAAQVNGDSVTQIVTLIDESGVVWTALYKLTRQPDGQWRIAGCVLAKAPETES
jgi:hypothetical protein